MTSLDKFLEFHIGRVLTEASIPVDLNRVIQEAGAVLEEREMIPEAAMHAKDGRFHIFLQSNFSSMPGFAQRRRFSLAHEIGHTLFYELKNGELIHRNDAPRGDALEAACHRAAAMILVPTKLLRAELRQRECSGARAVVDLAGRFDVSIEVMVRRLAECGVFENGWAPALVRRSEGRLLIEYVAYRPWLMTHIGARPKRGTELTSWFGGTVDSNGALTKAVGGEVLDATPTNVSNSLVIFELRLRSFGAA